MEELQFVWSWASQALFRRQQWAIHAELVRAVVAHGSLQGISRELLMAFVANMPGCPVRAWLIIRIPFGVFLLFEPGRENQKLACTHGLVKGWNSRHSFTVATALVAALLAYTGRSLE